MKAFLSFTRKEFLESWRTYKFAILMAVFVLLGIMSPLFAKLTPEILGSLDMGEIALTLPEPTAFNAWEQFFKNVGQMGFLALIIIFSGIMASELRKGTLVNLLTKGMKRHTVVYAKFLTATVLWTIAYLICLAICALYTAYLWDLNNLSFFAFAGLWLFGVFLIALLIFGGTLFKNTYGSLLFAGAVIAILTVINIAPQLHSYNPISLAGDTLTLLSGEKQTADFLPAMMICAGSTVALIMATIPIFRKKQL